MTSSVRLATWLPVPTLAATLATYKRRTLRADLPAAVAVTAVLIPLGLAYGELAGLSPVAGLYTGVFAMIGYAVFATSRLLILGPESQIAILVAAGLAPLAANDPQKYGQLAALMALMAAVVCVGASLLRLGRLADLLSYPVLVGYLTGVALIIIVSQAAKLIGGSASGQTLVALTRSLWENRSEADWPTSVLGLSCLLAMFVLRRISRKLPAALIVVIVATAVSGVFDLVADGITTVGPVPRGLPLPSLPPLSLSDITSLLLPTLGVVAVVFANTVLTGRSYALRSGNQRIDANAELAALAAGNLAAGLFSVVFQPRYSAAQVDA